MGLSTSQLRIDFFAGYLRLAMIYDNTTIIGYILEFKMLQLLDIWLEFVIPGLVGNLADFPNGKSSILGIYSDFFYGI